LPNFRDDGQAFSAVRSILIETWDPLGVKGVLGAADEYDQQVLVVIGMLEAGKEILTIAGYLQRAEQELIGRDADVEICERTAVALVALRAKRTS
jgi:hypothetical protein